MEVQQREVVTAEINFWGLTADGKMAASYIQRVNGSSTASVRAMVKDREIGETVVRLGGKR